MPGLTPDLTPGLDRAEGLFYLSGMKQGDALKRL